MDKNTYCVYRHTFPNGKVYIGITGGSPEKRWQKGMAYRSNHLMFQDIVKYGWENIAHEVLQSGLSEAEAKEAERDLIRSYGAAVRKKTYNIQHAVEGFSVDDWRDLVVASKDGVKHKIDFYFLNDDWLEYYQDEISRSVSFDLDGEGVILHTIRNASDEAGDLVFEDWILRYPQLFMTFREVYDWLWTHPDYELLNKRYGRKPTVFPFLNEG